MAPKTTCLLLLLLLLGLLQGTAAAGDNEGFTEIDPDFEPDSRGYLIFYLGGMMDAFGEQVERLLGAMAFAQALDRTLVLPRFHMGNKFREFSEYFRLDEMAKYHRVIEAGAFMEKIAPFIWPRGSRTIFCRNPTRDNPKECRMWWPCWKDLDITEFDNHVLTPLGYTEDDADTWEGRFPADEYPVIALTLSPGNLPVLSTHRKYQKFLQFNEAIIEPGRKYIEENFPGEKFVGIHLRNGPEWSNICTGYLPVEGQTLEKMLASPQCTDLQKGLKVKLGMCLPSEEEIKDQVTKIVKKTKATAVFVATNQFSMTSQLGKALGSGVTVFHMDPVNPLHDLYVLSQADHFIGNCVSAFTSFVTRDRQQRTRASAKLPTSFWGTI